MSARYLSGPTHALAGPRDSSPTKPYFCVPCPHKRGIGKMDRLQKCGLGNSIDKMVRKSAAKGMQGKALVHQSQTLYI